MFWPDGWVPRLFPSKAEGKPGWNRLGGSNKGFSFGHMLEVPADGQVQVLNV